jgi:hypothetical protein
MGAFKDFDAARAERVREPLEFVLGGETFITAAALPGGLLLDLGRAVTGGDDTASFAIFAEFFEAVIPPEDAERFAAVVRRVELDTIMDLMSWITEESIGRPLSRGSSSPGRSSPSGPSSKVVWSSPASNHSP